MYRLRVAFFRGEPIRYISHLDLLRLWERALRRARIPLAYTQGFNPHPRLSLAAPLSVGVVGEQELMDLVLTEPMEPAHFLAEVRRQMPEGLRLLAAEEVEWNAPALPAQVRAAEYRAELSPEVDTEGLEDKVAALLQATTLRRERRRDKETKRYDLRPLIEDLRVERTPESVSLWMRLRADPSGTGRPDEVLVALGIPPERASIRRLRLILDEGR